MESVDGQLPQPAQPGAPGMSPPPPPAPPPPPPSGPAHAPLPGPPPAVPPSEPAVPPPPPTHDLLAPPGAPPPAAGLSPSAPGVPSLPSVGAAPAPQSSGAPSLPRTPSFVTPPPRPVPDPAADAAATAGSVAASTSSANPTHDDRGLLPAPRLKVLFFLVQLASIPAASSVAAILVVQLVSVIVLMAWSAMAVTNARRARMSSAHSAAPRAILAALLWLSPIVVTVVVVTAIALVNREIDTATFDRQQTLRDIRVVAVLGGILAIVLSLAIPYGNLAKATRWVRGDGGRFWRWFWSPFITALLAGLVRAGLVLGLSQEIEGGVFSTTDLIALGLVVVTFVLPALVWYWMGWKAMTELEKAASMTWSRAANPIEDIDPGERFARAAALVAEQHNPR